MVALLRTTMPSTWFLTLAIILAHCPAVHSRNVMLGHNPHKVTSIHHPTSYFECYGTTPVRRSCLFTDIYFNIANGTFHLAGINDEEWGIIFDGVDMSPIFNISSLSNSSALQASDVYDQLDLSVFWTFRNHGATYSFGHALVHELFPMYTVLNNLLGEDIPKVFNLIHNNDRVPPVFGHIAVATWGRASKWEDLLALVQQSGRSWIRFERAIMGDGEHTSLANQLDTRQHPQPTFFNNIRWLGFRSWMLQSIGLDPHHHQRPQTPRIVLNDKDVEDSFHKGSKDRRKIQNIAELQRHLMAEFPEAQVESIKFTTLPWRHQLDVLSTTTVFITTEGSSSFRYVFMPPGAAVILLAHPDTMQPGVPQHKPQFHELDKYFPISFLRFIKYRVDVDSKGEYEEFRANDTGLALEYKLYHADIIVNLTRINPMVRAGIMFYELYLRGKPAVM